MYKYLLACLLALGFVPELKGQSKEILVLSYNVENLCDTIDDARTADDEFTPEGAKRWNGYRYRRKLQQIAEVISRAGELHWPSLVGLVEIENASTLDDLLARTPLGRKGYKYLITRHSLDPRGMNVALLYRPPLKLLSSQEFAIPFSDTTKRSRSILLGRFALTDSLSLNILLAHLPSRRGGAQATERYRREGARLLRRISDSLHTAGERFILLMGDFNGEPGEEASHLDLGASLRLPPNEKTDTDTALSKVSLSSQTTDSLRLYNLTSYEVLTKHPPALYGSYCFRGLWYQLDQLIVSEHLLHPSSPLRYQEGSVQVYAPEWLCRGARHAGRIAPYRSYSGTFYQGGYSDHFPILLKLRMP